MSALNVSVIICSANRPSTLHETVTSLTHQTDRPDEVIVCVPDEASAMPETIALSMTRVIIGPRGSSSQRNRAIDQLSPGCDLVLFLDDDVELAEDFIAAIKATFERCPEVVLAGGVDIGHGANPGSMTRMAARNLIREAPERPGPQATPVIRNLSVLSYCALCTAKRVTLMPPSGKSPLVITKSVMGCAMCVRRALLQHVRFDERLVLYGYLEDLDFSAQCRRHGRVVFDSGAVLVHLEVSSGRGSEIKRGFSEIVNPVYVWTKGNASFFRTVLIGHLIKRPLQNLGRSLRSVSARRRLRGNLLAFSRLIAGALEPEYILRLGD